MDPGAGARFRDALSEESPLQIVGVTSAYAARQAERAGFRSLYLSGAGVANVSFGLPDLGLTSLENVLEDARRILGATSLPLLVDADTGWGTALNIARTVRELERTGVAGMHIEDQVSAKRCGHRPGKALVSKAEMVDRLKAAVDARRDASFLIMARTDALASEGLDQTLERALAYRDAGADALFAEAFQDLGQYRKLIASIRLPVLANLTEFGRTPLFSLADLRGVGVRMALYPLSAFRASAAAAEQVFSAIRREGTQKNVVGEMETREHLYDVLGYRKFEEVIDRLFQGEDGQDGK